jgi:hypothetical protein
MKKLMRVLSYLRESKEVGLVLAPKVGHVSAYIDASFACHVNGKSHTGMALSLGKGCILAKSVKQKIVTKSSAEAELVAASDSGGSLIYAKYFLEAQKEKLKDVVLYQDNESTIKLLKRGKPAADGSRHINIRFFWLSERLTKGELQVVYLPTENMLADILTKPLQGAHFIRLRDFLLNWRGDNRG